jgi:hypothetical protein
MPTSLGGSANQGIRLHVKNAAGTAGETIKKGTIVSWSSVAASNPAAEFIDIGTQTLDYGSGNFPKRIPVLLIDDAPADSTTPGAAGRLGVACTDIPYGGYGEICVFGCVEVLCDASITVGDVISANADGEAIDAANASHDNPIGVMLEAGVANTLKWAFVNCIGSAAGASSTGFLGKAY